MTKTIKAHMRMEERYEGLSMIFGDNIELKKKILEAIEHAKKETGKNPFIFEKISTDMTDIQSIYVEFHDDYHREGGEFFEIILHELGIECKDETC
jgi:hypothetical protein